MGRHSIFLFVALWFLTVVANCQDSTFLESHNEQEIHYLDESHGHDHDDTLTVVKRSFDPTILDKLKQDEDFDYSQPPTVGESLWDRFVRWVSEFISKILRGAVNTNWGRVLLYAACLVVLVFVVMAILKVDGFKILFKGSETPSVKGVFHENIHEMDFEVLIKDAAQRGDYRNAVRLVFLYSLKLLSDKHHINWEPGKTNHDYLNELKPGDVRTGLGELSFYFDYAWYGGFEITPPQFDTVNGIFKNWREGIA